MTRRPADPQSDPDVPQGMSIELLKDLHLLTRDGQLNADARRKLKQIRHLMGLLKPALDDAFARHPEPLIVDCGAGKSYLAFLLHELVVGPAGRGTLLSVESRGELVEGARARAARFAHARMRFVQASIADADAGAVAAGARVVTALHACDTATDDALALAIRAGAEHIAVVPCCQAEVARQLAQPAPRDADDQALIAHPIHRREFGSHLTNVLRGLCLEAHGYTVTVTELVGWEHSMKNELILARRVRARDARDNRARATLERLLQRWRVQPALFGKLSARRDEPMAPPPQTAAEG